MRSAAPVIGASAKNPLAVSMDLSPAANAFANTGSGPLWTDLDVAAVLQQVRGRIWTAVDVPDLSTDQKA
jgi:hypothetical protein